MSHEIGIVIILIISFLVFLKTLFVGEILVFGIGTNMERNIQIGILIEKLGINFSTKKKITIKERLCV